MKKSLLYLLLLLPYFGFGQTMKIAPKQIRPGEVGQTLITNPAGETDWGEAGGTDNVVRTIDVYSTDLSTNDEQGIINYFNSTGLTIGERDVIIVNVTTPVPIVLDPATEAVLDYADLNGFDKPTQPYVLKLDTFIRDIKAAGLWAKFDILYWFVGDGDLEFKSINLINPALSGTPLGGLTSTLQGIEGNGVDGYINTNYNPRVEVSGKYQLDDAGRFAFLYKGATSTQRVIDGVLDNGSFNTIYNQASTSQRINQGATSLDNAIDLSGTGFKSINRTSLTDVVLYNEAGEYNETTRSVNIGDMRSSPQTLFSRQVTFTSNAAISCYGFGSAIVSQDAANLRQIILNNL